MSPLHVFPGIYSWVKYCCSSPSLPHYNNQFISSSEGAQQGDPFGPLLFCLVLHKFVKKVRVKISAFKLIAGTLMMVSKVLADIIHFIQSDGPALGLHINLEKV